MLVKNKCYKNDVGKHARMLNVKFTEMQNRSVEAYKTRDLIMQVIWETPPLKKAFIRKTGGYKLMVDVLEDYEWGN